MAGHKQSILVGFVAVFLLSCAHGGLSRSSSVSDRVGILVMAHGGSAEWNSAVEDAVVSLSVFCPVVVAFGMAERDSLQSAVKQLESQGVTKIAVIRIFISAQSFYHQTQYLLGLRPDPSEEFVQHNSRSQGDNHIPPPIQRDSNSVFVLNRHGLADSPAMGEVLSERVSALSVSPQNESVLILAHGWEDDAEDGLLVSKINSLAGQVRKVGPFHTVLVETLREDWKDKRIISEKRIRDFVDGENRRGRLVIVVPFRVFGFGPYGDVLRGLNYAADGHALLPHQKVTEWIKMEAKDSFFRAGWPDPFDRER